MNPKDRLKMMLEQGKDPRFLPVGHPQREKNLEEFLRPSKVKRVLYHGTTKSFDSFDPKMHGEKDHGWYGLGHYFTADPETASAYSSYDEIKEGNFIRPPTGANVIPAYVQIKNPYIWPKDRKPAQDKHEAKLLTQELIKAGHDGVIVPNEYQHPDYAEHHEVVAFHPHQIKSAIGNRGTYDKREEDINKAGGGEVEPTNIPMGRAARRAQERMSFSPKTLEMTGYHGSPHLFAPTEANPLGEFDASKIGTGEGAQAYGHGLYVAEDPSVGTQYRYSTSANQYETSKGVLRSSDLVDHLVREAGDVPPQLKSALAAKANEALIEMIMKDKTGADVANEIEKSKYGKMYSGLVSALRNLDPKKSQGSLYHVHIPDEKIEQMLDWDKPLSEQSESVRKALGVSDGYSFHNLGDAGRVTLHGKSMTGNDLLAEITSLLGENSKSAASEYLRSIGIPGIKYLDERSRGATGSGRWQLKFKDGSTKVYDFKPNDDVLKKMGATAEPFVTRNFVIFPGEEKHLKIIKREKDGGQVRKATGGPISQDAMRLALINKKPSDEIAHKADGGIIKETTMPTLAQMKAALQRGANNLQSIGAQEAPDMSPKVYIPPDQPSNRFLPPGGVSTPSGMPIGGIDMSRQAGQQLMPQNMMQPGGMAGNQITPGGPQGPQDQPQQGAPQGGSNILSLTPQGQALSALKPSPGPQGPPQAMADGGQAKVYTHEVYNRRTGEVKGKYQSAQSARRMRDMYDNQYGGYAHGVRQIGASPEEGKEKLADGGTATATLDSTPEYLSSTRPSTPPMAIMRQLVQMGQKMAEGGMAGGGSKITKRQQTVKNAMRMAYPGVYDRPDVIAEQAAARVAPEDPALKQLFGVTRDEMYEQSKGREGNLLGALPGGAANPKGTEPSENVMNPRNTQRIIDVLSEAEKYPHLTKGMDAWYYMDPLFQRMVKLLGIDRAREEYRKLNALMGMSSANSDVETEIQRGSAANMMSNLGRFEDFAKFGGKRGIPGRPDILGEMPGHMAHKTAHVTPMKKFLDRGAVDMKSPKVPMYIEASGVPEIGFQTRTPVGDAHWARGVGLADTRPMKKIKGKEVIPSQSVTNPEMSVLGPWWREKVAKKVGLESVPAQARAWGAFAPQTGVETAVGAPKLELIAKQIMKTAKRKNISPEKARDLILSGEERAGFKKGGQVSMDAMKLALTNKKAK